MEFLLFVVGLCMGSFVTALTWRIHDAKQLIGKSSLSRRQLSITTGRSMCPKCQHVLGPLDLVPVVSWLLLKRRCRFCRQPISWQYPVTEIVTGLLFAGSFLFWPVPLRGFGLFEFIVWCLCLVGLVALAVYDLRWFILPTRIILPLQALVVIQVLVLTFIYNGGYQTILHALWGVLLAGGLFYIMYLVSNGAWIGGGDVRLGVLIGLLLGGPLMSILMLFLASVAGMLASLPLLVSHKLKRNSRIPFGPFLILGLIITRLFGMAIITWYQHLVGG